ncbi:hypothetical protein [Bacillus sp. EB01]|nr:hypothetical protein [Bacillus sp. EB01]
MADNKKQDPMEKANEDMDRIKKEVAEEIDLYKKRAGIANKDESENNKE